MLNWCLFSRSELEVLLGTDFEKGLSGSAALMRSTETDAAAKEIKEFFHPIALFGRNLGGILCDFSVLLLVISAVLCEIFAPGGGGVLKIIIGFVFVCALLRTVLALFDERNTAELTSDDSIKVLRDGKIRNVKSSSLVRGDVIILAKGDIAPFDLRLVESENLSVIEKFGGKRIKPVAKDAMYFPFDAGSIPQRQRRNMVYKGSAVTSGDALAVVIDDRMTLEKARKLVTIGDDVAEFYAEKDNTPTTGTRFARRSAFGTQFSGGMGYSEENSAMTVAGRVITVMRICALSVGTVIFLLGVLAKVPLADAFLFGVLLMSCAPAVLYELCIAVAFTVGSIRLRGQKIKIGNFESAEKLAMSKSILCSTGTGYSIDKMYTQAAYAGRSFEFSKESAKHISKLTELFLRVGELYYKTDKNGSVSISGDTEGLAVLDGARKTGIVKDGSEKAFIERLSEFYDINGSLIASHSIYRGKRILITKGSTAAILKKCSHYEADDTIRSLDTTMRDRIISNAKSYENNESCRVVAIAYKMCEYVKRSDFRTGFVFAGFVVFGTSVNFDSAKYVDILRKNGITPVLFSGVSSDMVLNDAKKMGFLRSSDNYITSKSFSSLDENIYSEDLGTYTLYMGFGSLQKRAVVRNKKYSEKIVAVAADNPADAFDMSEADVLMSFGKDAPKTLRRVSDIHSVEKGIGVIYRTVCICRNMLRCAALSAGYLICAQISATVLCLFGMISAFFTGGALPMGIPQLCALTFVSDLVIAMLAALVRTPQSIISDTPQDFYEYFRLSRIIPKAAFAGVSCGCTAFLALLVGVFFSRSMAAGIACASATFYISKCLVSLFCVMTTSTRRAPAHFPFLAAVAEIVLGLVLALSFGTDVLPIGFGIKIPLICLVLSAVPTVLTLIYQKLERSR